MFRMAVKPMNPVVALNETFLPTRQTKPDSSSNKPESPATHCADAAQPPPEPAHKLQGVGFRGLSHLSH